MKENFNVIVILGYWVNSLLITTRTRSSQVPLGNGGMHQWYCLKAAILKTCFCPMETYLEHYKNSQWLPCQKWHNCLQLKAKFQQEHTISEGSQAQDFLISQYIVKTFLRASAAIYSLAENLEVFHEIYFSFTYNTSSYWVYSPKELLYFQVSYEADDRLDSLCLHSLIFYIFGGKYSGTKKSVKGGLQVFKSRRIWTFLKKEDQ